MKSSEAHSSYEVGPEGPMSIVRSWRDSAAEASETHPNTMALATVDGDSRASNRIVQAIELRNTGVVFATHSGSRKGRDLKTTGWASGVFFWRGCGRQVSVSGPAAPLPEHESDRLWTARPLSMLPMSVASQQSEPLRDEVELRSKAERLAALDRPLRRPPTWKGYLLTPHAVELWETATDRLYLRLRYEQDDHGWRCIRLQP